jgi:hypothetical protein
VAGFCEYGDEPSRSVTIELVIIPTINSDYFRKLHFRNADYNGQGLSFL